MEARYGCKVQGSGWFADCELDESDFEDGGDDEPHVDDELGGDDEPSLGAAEPLEPEPGDGAFWCGRWSKFTKAEREAVYDQVGWFAGYDGDQEVDADHEQYARTDPAKVKAARERRRPHQAKLDIETRGDGRLVQVTRTSQGRCNVRPLTSEECKRYGASTLTADERKRFGL